jgi:hypothetical protein
MLTNLQLKLVKIENRNVRLARAIIFQLAVVAVIGAMVRAIFTTTQTQTGHRRQVCQSAEKRRCNPYGVGANSRPATLAFEFSGNFKRGLYR